MQTNHNFLPYVLPLPSLCRIIGSKIRILLSKKSRSLFLKRQAAVVCGQSCEGKRQVSDSIFIYGIAWQVDPVIPVDASPAFVQLHLLKQSLHGCQIFVAFNSIYIFFYIINHSFAIKIDAAGNSFVIISYSSLWK